MFTFESNTKRTLNSGGHWPLMAAAGHNDTMVILASTASLVSAVPPPDTPPDAVKALLEGLQPYFVAAQRLRHHRNLVNYLASYLNPLMLMFRAIFHTDAAAKGAMTIFIRSLMRGIETTLPYAVAQNYVREVVHRVQQATLVTVTSNQGPLALGQIPVPSAPAGFGGLDGFGLAGTSAFRHSDWPGFEPSSSSLSGTSVPAGTTGEPGAGQTIGTLAGLAAGGGSAGAAAGGAAGKALEGLFDKLV